MVETRPIRYHIDFDIIPSLYHKDPESFAEAFAMGADELLAKIYTDVYKESDSNCSGETGRQFSKTDFRVFTKIYYFTPSIHYVTLPPSEDGSHVYCTAFALTVKKDKVNFYTIEKSVLGTTCIGTVDQNGHHVNFGPAGHSVAENIEIIRRIERHQKEISPIEVNKTVNPDGSYMECILDKERNVAEITEYDANGELTRTTYGRFV